MTVRRVHALWVLPKFVRILAVHIQDTNEALQWVKNTPTEISAIVSSFAQDGKESGLTVLQALKKSREVPVISTCSFVLLVFTSTMLSTRVC